MGENCEKTERLWCAGRLGRILCRGNVLPRNDVAGAMCWFGAPGTFGVHDRDDQAVIRLVHADQTFTGQPLARQSTQDPHLKLLDLTALRDV